MQQVRTSDLHTCSKSLLKPFEQQDSQPTGRYSYACGCQCLALPHGNVDIYIYIYIYKQIFEWSLPLPGEILNMASMAAFIRLKPQSEFVANEISSQHGC